jgi:hypothetical protein
MSTIPLRIDSRLVHEARNAGALDDRSPTAQIEHWAKIGRVVEGVLTVKSLSKVKQLARVNELDSVLRMTQTETGRVRAKVLIAKEQGVTYSADPENPDLVIQRQADGSLLRGRFSNRKFVPLGAPKRRRKSADKSKPSQIRQRAVKDARQAPENRARGRTKSP